MSESAELLSRPTNYAVVQLPGRKLGLALTTGTSGAFCRHLSPFAPRPASPPPRDVAHRAVHGAVLTDAGITPNGVDDSLDGGFRFQIDTAALKEQESFAGRQFLELDTHCATGLDQFFEFNEGE